MKVRFKSKNEIRMKIAEQGKSLRKFSTDIGISQGYLSQLLSGERNPSAKVAYKIAKGLNEELNSIFLIRLIENTNHGKISQ